MSSSIFSDLDINHITECLLKIGKFATAKCAPETPRRLSTQMCFLFWCSSEQSRFRTISTGTELELYDLYASCYNRRSISTEELFHFDVLALPSG